MGIRRVIVCFSLVMIFGISFFNFGSENASAVAKDIITDGFESGLNSSWEVNDDNVNSGLDYWGISTQRAASGTHSAWCAQVGTNSVNSLANSANHYYDQDMDAWLVIPTGDISAYDSAELGFYVWYSTGSFSLADYLWVGNSTDDVWYYELWTQTAVSSSGWEYYWVDLPTCSTSIAFEFISDSTVGFGPYEGAYIDDITISVYDNSKPSSSVDTIMLPSITNNSICQIYYNADDTGGSGLAYSELFYRFGTSGSFTKYTTASNPGGHWALVPPYHISFNFTGKGGDGLYQFYTIVTDKLGNVETAPVSPDDSIILDTTPPNVLDINFEGTSGPDDWYRSNVIVNITASDSLSGIASISYTFHSGIGSVFIYSGNFTLVNEGNYTISYGATDKAGNHVGKTSTIRIDKTVPDALILTPSNGTSIRGTGVSISWQCSDENSIAKQEIKYDALGWTTVTGTSINANLATGSHTIQLRFTDPAGNQVIKSVTFSIDAEAFSFGGPYYGLPTIGIIAAVVLAAIYMLMRTRKRKRAPTIEPQPIEKPPEPVGDQYHPL